MTPRDNLRRAMEEYLARRYPGTRWSVGLAGDEPAQEVDRQGTPEQHPAAEEDDDG